jgi:hypothetical protein
MHVEAKAVTDKGIQEMRLEVGSIRSDVTVYRDQVILEVKENKKALEGRMGEISADLNRVTKQALPHIDNALNQTLANQDVLLDYDRGLVTELNKHTSISHQVHTTTVNTLEEMLRTASKQPLLFQEGRDAYEKGASKFAGLAQILELEENKPELVSIEAIEAMRLSPGAPRGLPGQWSSGYDVPVLENRMLPKPLWHGTLPWPRASRVLAAAELASSSNASDAAITASTEAVGTSTGGRRLWARAGSHHRSSYS